MRVESQQERLTSLENQTGQARPFWTTSNGILLKLRAFHADTILQIASYVLARPMFHGGEDITVIAPHQDDETLGCGGLIALKRQCGAEVKVIFLTDGGNAPLPPDGTIVRADLPGVRIQESKAALAALGVTEGNLHFLECKDGALNRLSGPEREQFIVRLSALITECSPDQVFVTHKDEGHGDHEAAYELTLEAVRPVRKAIQIFQYLIWKPWLHPLSRMSFLKDLHKGYRLPIDDVMGKKISALAAYVSQTATLPQGFLTRFQRPYELFIPVDNPGGGVSHKSAACET